MKGILLPLKLLALALLFSSASGLIPAAPAQTAAPVFYTVKQDDSRLFLYQVVEGSAAKSGLWEDHRSLPVSRAKPVLLPKGQKVQVLKNLKVSYTAAETQSESATLEVFYVEAKADSFKNHDGRIVPFKTLSGWILKERLEK